MHASSSASQNVDQFIGLSVAKDFSETPGPRSRDEGDFSGQQFLEEHLLPQFIKALQENKKLVVDLDGTEGYATSFLESSFGGLARKYDPAEVLRLINFKSDDEPFLIQEIIKYITDARQV
jgi:STAS-like domain of unknown function (DUF4325)